MVTALEEAGLRATAPAMLAGNGLVPGSPRQLARKEDICEGATPREHSHYFTSDGLFGSLNWNDKPVGEAPYELVGTDILRIGSGKFVSEFRYTITDGGDTLRLEPIIEASARREALEEPLKFNVAPLSVTVAFPGHTWSRVDCAGWC
jgi:hypothetical protein